MSLASKQRHRLKTIGKTWTAWTQIQVTDKMRQEHAYLLHCHSIYQNSRYRVVMFACTSPIGAVMQCDVSRHVSGDEIPWSDLQRLKAELFSPDAVALEVFPADAIEFKTEARFRVLWIMPTSYELPMGLHLPTAFGGQA